MHYDDNELRVYAYTVPIKENKTYGSKSSTMPCIFLDDILL